MTDHENNWFLRDIVLETEEFIQLEALESLDQYLPHDPDFPVQCHICNVRLTSPRHLKKHQQNEHSTHLLCIFCHDLIPTEEGRTAAFCKHLIRCGKAKFATANNVRRAVPLDPKPHTCKKCCFTFDTGFSLQKHQSVGCLGKVKCHYCTHLFATANVAAMHMYAKHVGFTCMECMCQFETWLQLAVHNKTKHGKHLEKCGECVEGAEGEQYTKHLLESHGTSVHCVLCAASLGGIKHVAQHNSMEHENLCFEHRLKYQCNVCELVFDATGSLMEHISQHQGLFCSVCTQYFDTLQLKIKHEATVHGEVSTDMLPTGHYYYHADSVHSKTSELISVHPSQVPALMLNTRIKKQINSYLTSGRLDKTWHIHCTQCEKNFSTLFALESHVENSHGIFAKKELDSNISSILKQVSMKPLRLEVFNYARMRGPAQQPKQDVSHNVMATRDKKIDSNRAGLAPSLVKIDGHYNNYARMSTSAQQPKQDVNHNVMATRDKKIDSNRAGLAPSLAKIDGHYNKKAGKLIGWWYKILPNSAKRPCCLCTHGSEAYLYTESKLRFHLETAHLENEESIEKKVEESRLMCVKSIDEGNSTSTNIGFITSEKQQCMLCKISGNQNKFFTVKELEGHLYNTHFKCPKCASIFHSMHILNKHIKINHLEDSGPSFQVLNENGELIVDKIHFVNGMDPELLLIKPSQMFAVIGDLGLIKVIEGLLAKSENIWRIQCCDCEGEFHTLPRFVNHVETTHAVCEKIPYNPMNKLCIKIKSEKKHILQAHQNNIEADFNSVLKTEQSNDLTQMPNNAIARPKDSDLDLKITSVFSLVRSSQNGIESEKSQLEQIDMSTTSNADAGITEIVHVEPSENTSICLELSDKKDSHENTPAGLSAQNRIGKLKNQKIEKSENSSDAIIPESAHVKASGSYSNCSGLSEDKNSPHGTPLQIHQVRNEGGKPAASVPSRVRVSLQGNKQQMSPIASAYLDPKAVRFQTSIDCQNNARFTKVVENMDQVCNREQGVDKFLKIIREKSDQILKIKERRKQTHKVKETEVQFPEFKTEAHTLLNQKKSKFIPILPKPTPIQTMLIQIPETFYQIPENLGQGQPKFIQTPANFDNVTYKCKSCSVVHTDKQAALRHFQVCGVTCMVCSKTFPNEMELEHHLVATLSCYRNAKKLHECLSCTDNVRSRFVTATGLRVHMQIAHPALLASAEHSPTSHQDPSRDIETRVKYKCKSCSVVHTDKQAAVRHLTVCLLKCKVCNRSFKNEEELKQHLECNLVCSSSIKERYDNVCMLCSKPSEIIKFSNAAEFKKHLYIAHYAWYAYQQDMKRTHEGPTEGETDTKIKKLCVNSSDREIHHQVTRTCDEPTEQECVTVEPIKQPCMLCTDGVKGSQLFTLEELALHFERYHGKHPTGKQQNERKYTTDLDTRNWTGPQEFSSFKLVKCVNSSGQARKPVEVAFNPTQPLKSSFPLLDPDYEYACTVITKPLLNNELGAENTTLYHCNLCPTSFDTEAHLFQHNTMFHPKCHMCKSEKRFIDWKSLEAHQEKEGHCPFRCEVCWRRYKSASALKAHLDQYKWISNPVVLLCPREGCQKRFHIQKALDWHLDKEHPHEKCVICGLGLQWYTGLEKHMKQIHGMTRIIVKKVKRKVKNEVVIDSTEGVLSLRSKASIT